MWMRIASAGRTKVNQSYRLADGGEREINDGKIEILLDKITRDRKRTLNRIRTNDDPGKGRSYEIRKERHISYDMSRRETYIILELMVRL